MTMVPTLIASSVGAGRTQGASLSDPAYNDPPQLSAALWEGKIQLHPCAGTEDPDYQRRGQATRGVGSLNASSVNAFIFISKLVTILSMMISYLSCLNTE